MKQHSQKDYCWILSIKNKKTWFKIFRTGQAYNLLNKTYDGDISDYMLNNYNILAFDYYLGDNDNSTEAFFPTMANIIPVLSQNYNSAFYFISKTGDFLK